MTEKKTPSTPQQRDELLVMLDMAVEAYVITKRRYPLLLATTKEMNNLMGRLNEKKPSRKVRVRNDAVLQLLRDSFDMFVIDLFSLRQSLIKGGLLNRLKENPARLKRCDPLEISPDPVILSGDLRGVNLARLKAEVQQHRREEIARSINDSLAALVPNEYPVTPKGIDALIERFRKETEPLDADRNRVRAHRYERNFDAQYFQRLEDLHAQLEIFERLLGDLFHVLKRNVFVFKLAYRADTAGTAKDLADLMVHGGIHEAVNAYGVARKTNKNPVPWYYSHRERFFERPTKLNGGEQET